MNPSVIIYFLAIIAMLGIFTTVFLKFYFASAVLESQITGIWSTNDDRTRILIYYLNSRLQGEIVWISEQDDKLLGATVIQNMSLRCYGWSNGTYIDPVTRTQSDFRLKLRNKGRLCLRFFNRSGHLLKQENWKLVT
jgi:Uncharacterized protein conserved in bacteria (DUF2147)